MSRDKAINADREFSFTPRDFQRVRGLIYERAGISLADGKQDLVYSRLARRLRATRHGVFADYLDALEADAASPEWEAFTNALTTNLTSFFREAHHFDMLRDQLLRLPRGQRALIWSCAASTGEEPYSIAMVAAEVFGSLNPPVSILATDIDTNVLATGQQGIYALDRIAGLSPERVKKFFRRGTGANEGKCRVVDELRGLITFRRLNLLDASWGLKGPFEAIFCRNVMIYFDKPTQQRLLGKLVPLLADDGLLFTGHSESLFNVAELLTMAGRTAYRPRARRRTGVPA
ncbi:MAG: chemotaxis protein CheR [Nevskiales bacterium]|nr:chemotaxis protein CheR [Nevskiales bacterium]